MDLRVAGIGKGGAPLVRAPDGRGVGAPGVGREIEHVAVPTGAEDDRVRRVGRDLARDHVADDDAAGLAVADDKSSISVRGYMVTPPRWISFSSAWYAPSSSCWPVWPRA